MCKKDTKVNCRRDCEAEGLGHLGKVQRGDVEDELEVVRVVGSHVSFERLLG